MSKQSEGDCANAVAWKRQPLVHDPHHELSTPSLFLFSQKREKTVETKRRKREKDPSSDAFVTSAKNLRETEREQTMSHVTTSKAAHRQGGRMKQRSTAHFLSTKRLPSANRKYKCVATTLCIAAPLSCRDLLQLPWQEDDNGDGGSDGEMKNLNRVFGRPSPSRDFFSEQVGNFAR